MRIIAAVMVGALSATSVQAESGRDYRLRAGSPTMAARIGKFFGGGAGIWLRMQAAYDAWHAERDTDVSHIEPLRAA